MAPMKILALETAADPASVALWTDAECLERCCADGVSNSAGLLPLVNALLTERGLALADLDAIAFGSGPGSFTGLRVACGVAQGLAVGLDLPLIGIPTLQAMAARCGGRHVLVALDARMGEVYHACFVDGEPIGPTGVCAPDAVPLPPVLPGARWQACGSGLLSYPSLAARLAPHVAASMPEIAPSASAVARLAAPRLARGEHIDPALAAPVYVRDKVALTVRERLAAGGRP